MGKKRATPPLDDPLGWTDIVSDPIDVPDNLDLRSKRGVTTITVKRLGHADWKVIQSQAFTQVYEMYGDRANDAMELADRIRKQQDDAKQKMLPAAPVDDPPVEDVADEVDAALNANHPDWLCARGVTHFDKVALTEALWFERIMRTISTESVRWCAEQVLRFDGQFLPETEEQEKNVS